MTGQDMNTGQDAKQAARETGRTVRDELNRAGESVVSEARSVAKEAADIGRDHAEQRYEQGRDRLGNEAEAIGSAVDQAARRLHDENSPLAGYADEIASQISSFSSSLENTSLEDLASRTRRLARENPGLFVMGSVVAGIAAARFFKASEPGISGAAGTSDGRARLAGADRWSESDDYHGGRQAALAGTSPGYRSPVASTSSPYRDPASASAGGTTRVPMDSPDTHHDDGDHHATGVK